MRRAAQSSPSRPRARRKAPTAEVSAPPAPLSAPAPALRPTGSVEALVSLMVGVLLVVAALVPRSFRQLFLLGFGGALVHRGLMGQGGYSKAVSIDPAHQERKG